MDTMNLEEVVQKEIDRKNMLMNRLNELLEKGNGERLSMRSGIFSSLTDEEEIEKRQLYRELFPADPQRIRHLMKISGNLQKPDHYDDDSILQSPITNSQLNMLDTVERYMNAGYHLAFVSPDVGEEISKKRQLGLRSYIQRKKYIDVEIHATDESQTYKLEIITKVASGKRPTPGSGLGYIYIIDLPEELIHDEAQHSVHSDAGVSEV